MSSKLNAKQKNMLLLWKIVKWRVNGLKMKPSKLSPFHTLEVDRLTFHSILRLPSLGVSFASAGYNRNGRGERCLFGCCVRLCDVRVTGGCRVSSNCGLVLDVGGDTVQKKSVLHGQVWIFNYKNLRFWAGAAGLDFAVGSYRVSLVNGGDLCFGGGVDNWNFGLDLFVRGRGVDGWN
jgi:hypothetical protein